MKKQHYDHDPGLGTSYQNAVTRILNEDGSFNIQRVGTVNGYKDIYKFLIDLNPWKFAGFLVIAFFGLNFIFACIYFAIGINQLSGITHHNHPFLTAFYFSAQTFTTVGYGAIAPKGNLISMIASIEAFVGLIAFSIATGLIYGRFSKPSTKIAFTHNVLVAPYQNGLAVMFKIVNQRNSVLMNTKVHVIATMSHKDNRNDQYIRNYYNLTLETDFVRFFPLTWTIVHPITETSPFWNLNVDEIQEKSAELLIIVEAFDETFSQTVLQKHSYAAHQWLENVRFKRNFSANKAGKIVLNIRELNELESILDH
jgi:inward rectifier potassium channel